MLADYRRELASALGILNPADGVPLRATYIVGPDRAIRWPCVNDPSVGRSTRELLRVLAALQTGELVPCDWTPGQATLERPEHAGYARRWETGEYAVPPR